MLSTILLFGYGWKTASLHQYNLDVHQMYINCYYDLFENYSEIANKKINAATK